LQNNIFVVFHYEVTTSSITRTADFADIPSYKHSKKYIIDNKEYIVYTFEIQPDYVDDYNKIKSGAISQISDEAKQEILHYWRNNKTALSSLIKLLNTVCNPIVNVLGENSYIETRGKPHIIKDLH
jgi:hypothetical protein